MAGKPDVSGAVLAAIESHVFTIGEAVKGLPAAVTDGQPGVPWSDIARMRDLIGHHYYKLDEQIVRATIGQPLAGLRDACLELLAADDESESGA